MVEILVGLVVLLVCVHASYEAGRTRGYIDGLNDGSLAHLRRAKP